MMASLGGNLVFLISQPRAGSTLLQRILGNHPAIHTVSEPWLMLHPLYAFRQEGYQAEYCAERAWTALQSFLRTLPGGEEDYYSGIRVMYSYLYQRALQDSGKQYFVDKTPRYYMVIPEILRTFPEARYIILLRNPLAVLTSILNTWILGSWFNLHDFKHDLVSAPRLLLDGLEHLGERGIVIHYERLVEDPESHLRQICDALGVDFVPDMIHYGQGELPHWQYGDQESVYQHARPVIETPRKWIQALDNPQTWRLATDYLDLLGHDAVEGMGYSYSELASLLDTYQPNLMHRRLSVSLDWLLQEAPASRSAHSKILMQARGLVQREGCKGLALEAYGRVLNVLPKLR